MHISGEHFWIQHFKKLNYIQTLITWIQNKSFKQKFKNGEIEMATKFELLNDLFTEKEVKEALKMLQN